VSTPVPSARRQVVVSPLTRLSDVDTERLVLRLVAGDAAAIDALVDRAATSDDPVVLVAAALVVPSWRALLERAATAAGTARDRQLVAIATAHLAGDGPRTLLLARDHLADHPGSLLAAHIAAQASVPHTDTRGTQR
jgi:hypothetical protein